MSTFRTFLRWTQSERGRSVTTLSAEFSFIWMFALAGPMASLVGAWSVFPGLGCALIGVFSPSWFLRILSLAAIALLLFAFFEANRFTALHSGSLKPRSSAAHVLSSHAPASWSAVAGMRGRSLASSTPLSSVIWPSSALLAIAKRCRALLPTRSPKRSRDFVRRNSSFRPSDFVIHSPF